MSEILKKNLLKLDCQCKRCGLIYGIDHPIDDHFWPASGEKSKNKCKEYSYYEFPGRKFNLFKFKSKWYYVKSSLTLKFLSLDEIDDAIYGGISRPTPVRIDRQVDLYTLAKRYNLEGNLELNATQMKKAKNKSFVETVKGRYGS